MFARYFQSDSKRQAIFDVLRSKACKQVTIANLTEYANEPANEPEEFQIVAQIIHVKRGEAKRTYGYTPRGGKLKQEHFDQNHRMIFLRDLHSTEHFFVFMNSANDAKTVLAENHVNWINSTVAIYCPRIKGHFTGVPVLELSEPFVCVDKTFFKIDIPEIMYDPNTKGTDNDSLHSFCIKGVKKIHFRRLKLLESCGSAACDSNHDPVKKPCFGLDGGRQKKFALAGEVFGLPTINKPAKFRSHLLATLFVEKQFLGKMNDPINIIAFQKSVSSQLSAFFADKNTCTVEGYYKPKLELDGSEIVDPRSFHITTITFEPPMYGKKYNEVDDRTPFPLYSAHRPVETPLLQSSDDDDDFDEDGDEEGDRRRRVEHDEQQTQNFGHPPPNVNPTDTGNEESDEDALSMNGQHIDPPGDPQLDMSAGHPQVDNLSPNQDVQRDVMLDDCVMYFEAENPEMFRGLNEAERDSTQKQKRDDFNKLSDEELREKHDSFRSSAWDRDQARASSGGHQAGQSDNRSKVSSQDGTAAKRPRIDKRKQGPPPLTSAERNDMLKECVDFELLINADYLRDKTQDDVEFFMRRARTILNDKSDEGLRKEHAKLKKDVANKRRRNASKTSGAGILSGDTANPVADDDSRSDTRDKNGAHLGDKGGNLGATGETESDMEQD